MHNRSDVLSPKRKFNNFTCQPLSLTSHQSLTSYCSLLRTPLGRSELPLSKGLPRVTEALLRGVCFMFSGSDGKVRYANRLCSANPDIKLQADLTVGNANWTP